MCRPASRTKMLWEEKELLAISDQAQREQEPGHWENQSSHNSPACLSALQMALLKGCGYL